jgi:hypothetical protein
LTLGMFAQGNTDPAGGFCLQTLSRCSPTGIVGPVMDTVVISHDVTNMSCKESGWRVNMYLLHLFTASIRARRLAPSVVIPRGYKASRQPCANLRPLAQTPVASSPPSLWLKKKERQRDRSRNRGESCRAYMVLLLLPF